jgi:hypothetical protein
MSDLNGRSPGASTAQDMRVAQLLRAYQRELGHRPTMLERHTMRRAALLSTRAELAALDPNASPDEIARIDDRACRARDALAKIIRAAREQAPLPGPKSGGVGDLAPTQKIEAALAGPTA